MVLFGVKCPVCRARIQATMVRDKFFCPGCGAALVSKSTRINVLTVIMIVLGAPFVNQIVERLLFGFSLHEVYVVSTIAIVLIVLLIYPAVLSAFVRERNVESGVVRRKQSG